MKPHKPTGPRPAPLSVSQMRVLTALDQLAPENLVGDPPHVVRDPEGKALVPGYGPVPTQTLDALVRKGILVPAEPLSGSRYVRA